MMLRGDARKRNEARDHQPHWDAEVCKLIARTRAEVRRETLEECAQQARDQMWSFPGDVSTYAENEAYDRLAATFDAAAQAIREGES